MTADIYHHVKRLDWWSPEFHSKAAFLLRAGRGARVRIDGLLPPSCIAPVVPPGEIRQGEKLGNKLGGVWRYQRTVLPLVCTRQSVHSLSLLRSSVSQNMTGNSSFGGSTNAVSRSAGYLSKTWAAPVARKSRNLHGERACKWLGVRQSPLTSCIVAVVTHYHSPANFCEELLETAHKRSGCESMKLGKIVSV